MYLQVAYLLNILFLNPAESQDFSRHYDRDTENPYRKWDYEDDDYNDPYERYDQARSKKRHRPSTKMDRSVAGIKDVFNDISKNFQSIQKKCHSRKACLKEEKNLLINKSRLLGYRHPAYKHLQNILNLMTRYSRADIYVSQLYLFKRMSKKGQNDYRSGQRIQSLRHRNDPHREPPHYLVDDILNLAIQQIEKNRPRCKDRSQCLEYDRKILQDLARKLSTRDPSYKALMASAKALEKQADQQFYNGLALVNMYYQKGYNAAAKIRFASKEAQEWQDINQSKAESFHQARTVDYSRRQPSDQYPAQTQTHDDYSRYQQYPSRQPPYQEQRHQPLYAPYPPQQPFYQDEGYSHPSPSPRKGQKSGDNEGFFSIITNLFRL